MSHFLQGKLHFAQKQNCVGRCCKVWINTEKSKLGTAEPGEGLCFNLEHGILRILQCGRTSKVCWATYHYKRMDKKSSSGFNDNRSTARIRTPQRTFLWHGAGAFGGLIKPLVYRNAVLRKQAEPEKHRLKAEDGDVHGALCGIVTRLEISRWSHKKRGIRRW